MDGFHSVRVFCAGLSAGYLFFSRSAVACLSVCLAGWQGEVLALLCARLASWQAGSFVLRPVRLGLALPFAIPEHAAPGSLPSFPRLWEWIWAFPGNGIQEVCRASELAT